MAARKQVRTIKKIRDKAGVWRFVSLRRISSRYVWDKRPGYFFLDWREGKKCRRQLAGQTPRDAIEAQRRKVSELIGELVAGGKVPPPIEDGTATALGDARNSAGSMPTRSR